MRCGALHSARQQRRLGIPSQSCRGASRLNSIRKGIKSESSVKRFPGASDEGRNSNSLRGGLKRKVGSGKSVVAEHESWRSTRPGRSSSLSTARRTSNDNPFETEEPPASQQKKDHRRSRRAVDSEGSESSDHPPRIPFKTAASQFIYGRSAVLACLRAHRRRIYKAYVSKERDEGPAATEVVDLCRKTQTPIIHMTKPAQLIQMNDAAGLRPHNGLILDVSPLPMPPVSALRTPTVSSDGAAPVTALEISPQSQEEKTVNSKLQAFETTERWRQPFVVLLDGVLDQGNMGNIIRSAHFYGVDAVAICTATCAPINSAPVAKAASGALEVVPLLKIERPADFIRNSQREGGWEIWASVKPPPGPPQRSQRTSAPTTSRQLSSPLVERPVILMLGGEGEGLRRIMLEKADHTITIESVRSKVDVGVDSLNVSSAAAVLMEAFLRRPAAGASTDDDDGQSPDTHVSERIFDISQ